MREKKRVRWIQILCLAAVMAAAVIVRIPAGQLSGFAEEQRAVYTSQEGLPYLTDPDSYYHIRIAENDLKYGTLSENRAEDGTLWDTQSNYPAGRSAEYQKGIVYAAEAVWKIAGLFGEADLYTAAFWLPSVMAALAALAAFLLGYRISGTAGGFTAGILVSCASAFVARVLPGRYDTDMFSAVMDVLLILFLTEALRARGIRSRVLAAAGFALTAVAYSWCWSVYAFMFSVLTAAGGAVFLIVRTFVIHTDRGKEKRAHFFRKRPDIQAWLLCAGLMAVLLLFANGLSFFRQFWRRVFWAGSMTESGTLPNLLASVTELNRPVGIPSDPAEWFVAYVPGKTLSILNGIGGAAVVILCVGGILILLLRVLKVAPEETAAAEGTSEEYAAAKSSAETPEYGKTVSLLYLCVLGTWLVGGMYASQQGIRFVQHLAVPAGILAGSCVGSAALGIAAVRKGPEIIKILCIMLLCAAAAAIPVAGAVQICRLNRPSASDALEEGMEWIREIAEDPDAVIASWWDFGYYYEYASGHPAFWDGGSQNGMRAILIAKALTSRNITLSGRILQMLASYGNRPAEELSELLGEKTAFDALWETLLMDRMEAEECLEEKYGISRKESAELAGMLHPEQKKEIYLVISGDMLYKLGWIEYYADWDFSGNGRKPVATVYSVTPDGSADINTETEEARAFFEDRAKETIWRLFFGSDGEDVFIPAFETSDGISQLKVWEVK